MRSQKIFVIVKSQTLLPAPALYLYRKIDGTKITPVFRLINEYKYTDKDWGEFKSDLKKQHGNNYTEISSDSVPLLSSNLKKQIQSGGAIKVMNCIETNHICYYFADKEGMFHYTRYHFVEDVDETAVYIVYK